MVVSKNIKKNTKKINWKVMRSDICISSHGSKGCALISPSPSLKFDGFCMFPSFGIQNLRLPYIPVICYLLYCLSLVTVRYWGKDAIILPISFHRFLCVFYVVLSYLIRKTNVSLIISICGERNCFTDTVCCCCWDSLNRKSVMYCAPKIMQVHKKVISICGSKK